MLADVLQDWPVPDLCERCGHLHGSECPNPVTGPPAGLAGTDGELTGLGQVVEDAANYLAMRGYLDPDGEEWPNWVLAELAELADEQPCGPICFTTSDGHIHPSNMADHFLSRCQEEWELAIPVWECDCGRPFKVLPEALGTAFFEVSADGLLGEVVGWVRLNSKRQKVTHSGACPGCERKFADTISGQLEPERVRVTQTELFIEQPMHVEQQHRTRSQARGGQRSAADPPARRREDQCTLF